MIFFIVFPFLALGCTAFLICTAIFPLRRYALSALLWFAACGPCLLVCATGFVVSSIGLSGLNQLFQRNGLMGIGISFYQRTWFGCLIAIVFGAITFGGAIAITLVHGLITRRVTLALFRLYVAGVSFGVGVLTMFFVSFAVSSKLAWFIAVNLLGIIPAAFLAYFCYRNAKQFRGEYPQQFPIVSLEEFG